MGYTMTGLNKYSARLRSESKRIVDEGEDIAQDAAEFGANLMREFVRDSTTDYGNWRMAHGIGRGPGREDTGKLYDAIKVGQPRKLGAGGVSVSFGWGVDGGPRDEYFYFQEVGAKNIPPMHALLGALVASRQYFYARIKEVVQ